MYERVVANLISTDSSAFDICIQILKKLLSKMNLEKGYRKNVENWPAQDESAVNTTVMSMDGKRFQRSKSRNLINHQLINRQSEICMHRKNESHNNYGKQEFHSPYCQPNSPAYPHQPNVLSIFSPQYIRLPNCNEFMEREEKQSKNYSMYVPRKASDLPQNVHAAGFNDNNCHKQSLSKNNQNKPASNLNKTLKQGEKDKIQRNLSNHSLFLKAKKEMKSTNIDDGTQTESNYVEMMHQISQLEDSNVRLSKEVEATRKERDLWMRKWESQKDVRNKENLLSTSNAPYSKNQYYSNSINNQPIKEKSRKNDSCSQSDKNRSARETNLLKEVSNLSQQLSHLKEQKGVPMLEHIIFKLKEENSFFKRELEGVSLKYRMLEQQNRNLGENWKDHRKLMMEIKYLKACVDDCEEEINRLKGENKKLKKVKKERNLGESGNSFLGLGSEVDSLNLSTSWYDK